jgi:hypothetical protein
MVIMAPVARVPVHRRDAQPPRARSVVSGGTNELSREGLHAFPTQSNLCLRLECRVDCVDG